MRESGGCKHSERQVHIKQFSDASQNTRYRMYKTTRVLHPHLWTRTINSLCMCTWSYTHKYIRPWVQTLGGDVVYVRTRLVAFSQCSVILLGNNVLWDGGGNQSVTGCHSPVTRVRSVARPQTFPHIPAVEWDWGRNWSRERGQGGVGFTRALFTHTNTGCTGWLIEHYNGVCCVVYVMSNAVDRYIRDSLVPDRNVMRALGR